MSLITCPECNNTISDKALSCPHCGIHFQSEKLQNSKTGTKSNPISSFVAIFILLAVSISLWFIISQGQKSDADSNSEDDHNTALLDTINMSTVPQKQQSNVAEKEILPGDYGDEMGRLVYAGTVLVGNYTGTAKCLIFNNTGITEFDQDFGDLGTPTQTGKIIMNTTNNGTFKCENGSCDYEVYIDKNQLKIKGDNWDCDLKRVQ